MKKAVCIALAISFWVAGAALAATKAAPKTAAAAASAPVVAQAYPSEKASTTAARQVAEMKPGLAYNFLMDLKFFDMSNVNFANSNGPSKWYFYSTYRAALSNVFNNGIAVLADIEKPGYANATYPTLKVNEMFARYQSGNFYVKLGRQIFGDNDDLLLGFQSDAIAMGFALTNIDLNFFMAKPSLSMPWGNEMTGMLGFVPTFAFGDTMGLKAYLLLGTESLSVTSGGVTSDKINTLIQLGGKYYMNQPLSGAGQLDLGAQLGLQFAMAQDNAAQSIDATSLGLKLDGGYSMMSNSDFGFKVSGHIIFTGGDPEPMLNTKTGFVSNNALPESGPGLFSKIQDGAGAFTYVDSLRFGSKVQQAAGLFAFGITGEFDINKTIRPGLGLWIYSNTDKEGKMLGTEIDEWVKYHMSDMVSFYQQLAIALPNKEGLGLAPGDPSPGTAMKFLLGSSLMF